jgi:simple sugar transport system ATP-binding protein
MDVKMDLTDLKGRGNRIGPMAGTKVPAIEVRNISKVFPGVRANDRVCLAIYYGEVHCLLGENGSGKSTLINIMRGMEQPDAGTMLVDGEEILKMSPRKAIDMGIGAVYQHLTLVPVFTVAENIMLLGRRRKGDKGVFLNSRGRQAYLSRFAPILGADVDTTAPVGSLPLGQQQRVEIVKMIEGGYKVLIFDEPTSMLTPKGIEELEKMIHELRDEGYAILFITHKLNEALNVGDRISVMRRGRVVTSWGPEIVGALSRAQMQALILEAMFGKETGLVEEMAGVSGYVTGRTVRRAFPPEPVLELVDISVKARPGRGEVGVHGLSLTLCRGETLGIAGVDGNGQRELVEAIVGQRAVSSGDIRLRGRSVAKAAVRARRELGLHYVTDDRVGEGTLASLSVALNLVLKRIGEEPFWRHGRIREACVDETARKLVKEFDIRTTSAQSRCGTLSGGNIQKLILARELSFKPAVVIYSKPTHGLDFKTSLAVRDRIRALGETDGIASLLISTDMTELLNLCDRIAVLFKGRLMGTVENNTPEVNRKVGEMMLGVE